MWLERDRRVGGGELRVAALRLSRLSNATDLDALGREPDVSLFWTRDPAVVAHADLVILPGSKSTRADLAELARDGLLEAIRAARAGGAFVLGLCGGYQMLGREVADPDGHDGAAGVSEGLALLPIATHFAPVKVLALARGRELASGQPVEGYEIHMGRTTSDPGTAPLLTLDGRAEGAVSADGRVLGTYLHGLLDASGYRRTLLNRVRAARGLDALPIAPQLTRTERLDRLADALESALDLPWIEALIAACPPPPVHPELDGECVLPPL